MVGTSYFTDPADLSVTAWDAKFPQPSPATAKQNPAACAASNSFTSDGWPGCAQQWIGDYMKGGSATNGNQIDFAAVWPQCPAGNCAHYVQVVSVDVSKPLSVGNKFTNNWSPAMSTKAPKYDQLKYGPVVEPKVRRRP